MIAFELWALRADMVGIVTTFVSNVTAHVPFISFRLTQAQSSAMHAPLTNRSIVSALRPVSNCQMNSCEVCDMLIEPVHLHLTSDGWSSKVLWSVWAFFGRLAKFEVDGLPRVCQRRVCELGLCLCTPTVDSTFGFSSADEISATYVFPWRKQMGSRSAVLILSNPVTVTLLLSLCNARGVGLSISALLQPIGQAGGCVVG